MFDKSFINSKIKLNELKTIQKMIENLKARFAAVKYNIWTEQIDPKREADTFLSGDWYSNGKIYYGNPLFIFFESSQNFWFKEKIDVSDKIK